MKFCRATGSQAIITANYAAARYASLSKGTDLAARWVKDLNIDKKFKVRYWKSAMRFMAIGRGATMWMAGRI